MHHLVNVFRATDIAAKVKVLQELKLGLGNVDDVGHMGLLSSLSSKSLLEEPRTGLLALQALRASLEGSKLNATLLSLQGGLHRIADLVFNPSSPPASYHLIAPWAVVVLVAAFTVLDDPGATCSQTLSPFSASQQVVPKLLELLGGDEEWEEELTLARQHQAATRLLRLCLTLDTEVSCPFSSPNLNGRYMLIAWPTCLCRCLWSCGREVLVW